MVTRVETDEEEEEEEAREITLEVHGLLALDDSDEVAGHRPPLVDELVEGVLPVGAGLPEVDLPRLVGEGGAVHGHPLAVALHAHLLDVGGQFGQGLAVGQDGAGGIAPK